ncbi:MAG: hypothetical protein CL596_04450 [Alteromonas sp.]|nr:hypothetical protein [Alteromonas sp.]MAY21862.1 hypothetical protein [Flavobacteriaceae bacterium]|tara:strand:- start:163 stop:363 length:201 start_codon:yes stop_codon:yes gene_type:complete
MKVFRYILMGLAVALLIFNATKLNFDNLMEGDSQVALIGMVAAACVILLIAILNTSLKINQKRKKR